MKRPTLRISVFAATIALSTLGTCAIAQAEGPKPFYSKLNPKNWFRKSDDAAKKEDSKKADNEKSETKVSGETTTATRPYLKDDPFLVTPVDDEEAPAKVTKQAEAKDLPEIHAKPKASTERQTAKAAPAAKTPAESTPAPAKTPTAAKAPTTAKAPANAKGPANKGKQNEFAEGFDGDFAKLVETVKQETVNESEDEPTPAPAAAPRRTKLEPKPVAQTPASRKSDAPLMPDLNSAPADDEPEAQEVAESLPARALPERTLPDRMLPDTAASENKPAAVTPEVRSPRSIAKTEAKKPDLAGDQKEIEDKAEKADDSDAAEVDQFVVNQRAKDAEDAIKAAEAHLAEMERRAELAAQRAKAAPSATKSAAPRAPEAPVKPEKMREASGFVIVKADPAATQGITKITPEEAAAESAPVIMDDFVAAGRKEMDTALARTAQAQNVREAATKTNRPAAPAVAATPAPSIGLDVSKPVMLPRGEQTPRPKQTLESAIARKPAATPATDSPVKLMAPVDSSGLIVSSDLVPDRKFYTTSQAFQQAGRNAKSDISPTSSLSAPAVAKTDSKSDEQPHGGIIILPAGKAPRELDKTQSGTARVTANKAPGRLSPDGTRVQQLSYEDTAPLESHLPTLSINSSKSTADEGNGPLLILPKTSAEAAEEADDDATARASAPILEFPEEPETPRPKKSGSSGWLLGALAFIAAGCGIGVMIRKKGQFGAIAVAPAAADGENTAT